MFTKAHRTQLFLFCFCLPLFLPAGLRAAEPTEADRSKAESLYKVALIAIENHDWEVARKKLNEILAMVPDQPRALLRLAEAELNLGRPSAAKKALAKAKAAGVPDSDRVTADGLEPRIDYALEKQASETPTSALPRFGWRVDMARVGTWKSENGWGVPPVLVSGDPFALILLIKPPAKSGTDQEVPVDVTVFDQKREELKNTSNVFKNVIGRDNWWQSVPLGQVPSKMAELTVELRSEGKLVVRLRVPVEDAGEPPSASAVQHIVGHWQGKNGKDIRGKEEGELQVSGGASYPEFTYKYWHYRGDFRFVYAELSGRLRPGKGAAWLAREMVGRICGYNDCNDLNFEGYVLALEGNGENGLRVNAPWASSKNLILTKK